MQLQGRSPSDVPSKWHACPICSIRKPRHAGFEGTYGRGMRVAGVIKREFGVIYQLAHCSRILRAIKHRVQKPIRRARADEVAFERWKNER